MARELRYLGALIGILLAASVVLRVSASLGTNGKTGARVHDAGLDSQILGVFVGNDPKDILQFETWLGRKVDGVLGYTGHESWDDFDGSADWATGIWKNLDRRVLWSIPLIPKGAMLSEAAEGKFDRHYEKAARTLAGFRPNDAVIYVRTGWEFNGDWFPWAAREKQQDFIGAFRRFVTVFRSQSPRFKFEWNVNIGDVGMNPESAYPGDAYVDIIGMDFYWDLRWSPQNPMAAFDFMVGRKWGLKWHQEFAAAHDKPTAYSEWGIMSNDAGPYIEQVNAWFQRHKVTYQSYWNSNADFSGEISKGNYPAAAAAYKAAFGKPQPVSGSHD